MNQVVRRGPIAAFFVGDDDIFAFHRGGRSVSVEQFRTQSNLGHAEHVLDERSNLFRKRTVRRDRVLGATKLSGRDHFHGLGRLARIRYAPNPLF